MINIKLEQEAKQLVGKLVLNKGFLSIFENLNSSGCPIKNTGALRFGDYVFIVGFHKFRVAGWGNEFLAFRLLHKNQFGYSGGFNNDSQMDLFFQEVK